MLKPRVIPILLLQENGLVKTKNFKNPKYIGDPINAVRIFNEKEVDELIFLDITTTRYNKKINFELLSEIASECFMPLTYGGGVKDIDTIRKILKLGVEKICINSYMFKNANFVREAVKLFGSSTIVVSIDVKKNIFGKYKIWSHGGTKKVNTTFDNAIKLIEEIGVGEILINSIDKDGCMLGYDCSLINKVSKSVSIPVVASGGAGTIIDFQKAISNGASAVGAGSMFVLHGKHKAVLITYPNRKDIWLI